MHHAVPNRRCRKKNQIFCRFLNPNYFSQFEFELFYILVLRNLQEQIKKALCFKNCSGLPLQEKIVLLILQILGLIGFSLSLEQFFLTVG